MAQQGIAKGDVLQRLAGLSFIVGAILLIVFNFLFPRADDPSSATQFVQKVAENRGGFWEVDNLLLAVGFWALMIGFTGVYRSISTGGGAAWARLGYYGVIVGVTLWTALFALNGLGLPLLVEEAQNIADPVVGGTLFLVAASAVSLTMGLFSMSVIVFWLALTFVGVGMALNSPYPKWLGWAAIILGIATVAAVGLPQAFAGPSKTVTNLLFPILSSVSTVWALVVGLWITRKAW